MIDWKNRVVWVAGGIAVGAYLLLFSVRPVACERSPSLTRRLAPQSRYRCCSDQDIPAGAERVRVLNSPVLFSLPSSMGFSGLVGEYDVETRTSFKQQVHSDDFADAVPSGFPICKECGLESLLLWEGGRRLALPQMDQTDFTEIPVVRRVFMEDQLRNRLIEALVLPDALNAGGDEEWTVRAMLHITSEGFVEHVFLEQPLAVADLNEAVLRFFYNLRFKAGAELDTSVEIFSPSGLGRIGETP